MAGGGLKGGRVIDPANGIDLPVGDVLLEDGRVSAVAAHLNIDGVHEIDATGLPVGMFANEQFTSRTLQLRDGDTLLLYTDGVVEARNEMDDTEVLAKRDAGILWCARASDHAATYNGKSWQYVLIPHDAIAENMTLTGLADRFAIS